MNYGIAFKNHADNVCYLRDLRNRIASDRGYRPVSVTITALGSASSTKSKNSPAVVIVCSSLYPVTIFHSYNLYWLLHTTDHCWITTRFSLLMWSHVFIFIQVTDVIRTPVVIVPLLVEPPTWACPWYCSRPLF